MTTNAPFGTPDDVADGWRPLTDSETDVVQVLIDRASRRIRRLYPTVDARISSGALDEVEVVDVVAGMVKRAMMTAGQEGVTQQSQTAGPFSASQQYANPMGNLFLTADDKAVLADPRGSSRRAFSVDMAQPGCGYHHHHSYWITES